MLTKCPIISKLFQVFLIADMFARSQWRRSVGSTALRPPVMPPIRARASRTTLPTTLTSSPVRTGAQLAPAPVRPGQSEIILLLCSAAYLFDQTTAQEADSSVLLTLDKNNEIGWKSCFPSTEITCN